MPRGSPFTALCQLAATAARTVAADLHAHTTASDGDLTPDQIVAAAVAARLDAVAITDHDTTAAVPAARRAALSLGSRVEVVAGVEVSTELDGREVHVLGYFVDISDAALSRALAAVVAGRRERFRDFVAKIPELAPAVELGLVRLVEEATESPGRRHVASLLVRAGVVRSRHEAFRRVLDPLRGTVLPKVLVPLGEAVALIRAAGGVAGLAHPGPDADEAALTRFRDFGGQAVEAKFPAAALGRSRELRDLAKRVGLAVAGGSDCHSADVPGRVVGSKGITSAEFAALRVLARV